MHEERVNGERLSLGAERHLVLPTHVQQRRLDRHEENLE